MSLDKYNISPIIFFDETTISVDTPNKRKQLNQGSKKGIISPGKHLNLLFVRLELYFFYIKFLQLYEIAE